MAKITPGILPDAVYTAGDPPKFRQVQLFTLPNVKAILKFMGWVVRFDMMYYRPVIIAEEVGLGSEAQQMARLAIEDNCRRCGINPGEKLAKVLAGIGMQDRFHPMEDWIQATTWDNEDRLEALIATVPATGDMWPIYLRRWLVQVVEACTGWRDAEERALSYCLVFAGAQGIGKTQWFKHLAPGFVRTEAELHLSKMDSKDHKLDVLRFPIVELSEIDATFGASSISTLKTFLSTGRDVVRPPYGAEPVERIRSSVFGGTVNDAQFLTDPTGTRRFWPVYADGDIDWDHAIDMQQLFAQVWELWEAGEPMVLTAEEDAGRMAAAGAFHSVSPAVDAVASWWADAEGDYEHYAALSVSQICRLTGASTHPGAMPAIRQWLRDNLGWETTIGRKQRAWAFPLGITGSISTVNGMPISSAEARRRAKWREK